MASGIDRTAQIQELVAQVVDDPGLCQMLSNQILRITVECCNDAAAVALAAAAKELSRGDHERYNKETIIAFLEVRSALAPVLRSYPH